MREVETMPGQTVEAGNYEKGQDTSREDGDAPGHHIDDLGGNTTSVKPVDSPNEQTVSRDQRTGTTIESDSDVDMRIMSGSNPHVHDDAQCEVRGPSGSAND
ncbi:hypothetical protein JVT61DRAFT_1392 [Boletus reticuloceps]|uniref:Uncharacterized protein n=1 Tax=Boletus reticuloceps TaxID=495285 RepID=A0A8I2YCB0_9AGAM|nr:hypothetical protein JVT61DRAFT_1392 [Boletus reticuloceps]